MALRNYPEALKTARALIEPPLLPDTGNAEYARGIVEFMADLYPLPGLMEERKRIVAADLGLDPAMIA